MKFFFDTEFLERGPEYPIELISVGIVREDGQQYYAESADFDLNKMSPWLKKNVLPHLTGPRKSRVQIKSDILGFVDSKSLGKPEFWSYYADYDWVVFAQIMGSMVNLPEDYPKMCMDLAQYHKDIGAGRCHIPPNRKILHHALEDAIWHKDYYESLHKFAMLN